MAEYKSKFTGAQIDEAVGKALSGGDAGAPDQYIWSEEWNESAIMVKVETWNWDTFTGPISSPEYGYFDFCKSDRESNTKDMRFFIDRNYWVWGFGAYSSCTVCFNERAFTCEEDTGYLIQDYSIYEEADVDTSGIKKVEYLILNNYTGEVE